MKNTAKGKETLKLLLINERGEGQGFTTIKKDSKLIKEMITEWVQGLSDVYPFQMKFGGKTYHIICNENGMAQFHGIEPGIWMPQTCGMIHFSDPKQNVEFVDMDGSPMNIFDLKFNGVFPLKSLMGGEAEDRTPAVIKFWAIQHYGPILFLQTDLEFFK